MRPFITVAAGVLAAIILLIVSNGGAKPAAPLPASGAAPAPVIVELFTSEGCSSCPPADRLLARLDQTQPVPDARIIALEQHVDYWNADGWMDPFSSAQFSERQQEYVTALHANTAYTPQMVVDGAAEFVGSDERSAVEAIVKSARAPKAAIAIDRTIDPKPASPQSASLRVRLDAIADWNARDAADIVFAITEDNLFSNVTHGENSGSRLGHRAVVREMRTLGQVRANGSFEARLNEKFSQNWKRENLHAVVFVQARGSRRILGAAEIPLAPPVN